MNLLSIGGSDPSSGAGIQSDIRAFSLLDAHCLTVITAITSQNTTKFDTSEPVSRNALKSQLNSVMSDFKIDGIKIGMVYDSKTIQTVHQKLEKLKIPIVVDPVIKSTTGGLLIKDSAIKDFQKLIIPLATIITPNRFEAEILSKTRIDAKNSPKKVAKIIQKMGAQNVVITGIDGKDNQISDFVLEREKQYVVSGDKISKINHGSGCNYSAAMLFAFVKGDSMQESVKFAKQFAYDSIKNAKMLGRGIAITSTGQDSIKSELSEAINEFVGIKNIYKNIPECQTNFVSSRQKPETTGDVLGIAGRIVKSGRDVIVAGDLRYGGSKHVATALLAVNKKFPQVCSAINLKYQDVTISKIKKSKMTFSSYDRSQEPKNVKVGHSTIEWGIKNSIRNLNKAPDIVFHKGDFGKEPMIIVFGKTPDSIVKKILKVI